MSFSSLKRNSVIDFLIQRISLSRRIFFGYLITAITSCVLFLIIFTNFWKLASDFQKLARLDNQIIGNMSLVNRIGEIQRHARIYIYEGHEFSSQHVERLGQEIEASLANHRYGGGTELGHKENLIRSQLKNYMATFSDMRQQREKKHALVNIELRHHANVSQTHLESLRTQIHGGEFNRMLTALLQVEKYAYRYFDSLDATHVDTAIEQFRLIRTVIKHDKGNQRAFSDLLLAIERYEATLLEAVQRTRAYLFLVNVVLGADAYEIGYQATQLDSLIRQESEALQRQVDDRISATLNSVMIYTAALLVLLILVSLIIGRSISWPLQRLTRAFQALTDGRLQTEIPTYPLNDELGKLSIAAESFRVKSQTLADSKKQLERSNEEMEQFVYTVSHDLKSPIVTSMGFISIIKKLANDGKYPEAFEKLDKVVKANERMSQLITDLLELSRVGRVEMDITPLDLNELLEEFASQNIERLNRQGFELVQKNKLPVIQANRSRVLQVFENLISNALKYAGNPAGSLIEIGTESDTTDQFVYVKDNGPGIEPIYHEKIFGLFYRLDVSQEGTGIGLAVARKIMKYYGGDIWVESKPGEGATFWLRFPLTTVE